MSALVTLLVVMATAGCVGQPLEVTRVVERPVTRVVERTVVVTATQPSQQAMDIEKSVGRDVWHIEREIAPPSYFQNYTKSASDAGGKLYLPHVGGIFTYEADQESPSSFDPGSDGRPIDLAIDPDGDVLVLAMAVGNRGLERVNKYANGRRDSSWEISDELDCPDPRGIEADTFGNVWILCGRSLLKLSQSGELRLRLEVEGVTYADDAPTILEVDRLGNVYLASERSTRPQAGSSGWVRKYSINGELVGSLAQPTYGGVPFRPLHVAADDSGMLYVTVAGYGTLVFDGDLREAVDHIRIPKSALISQPDVFEVQVAGDGRLWAIGRETLRLLRRGSPTVPEAPGSVIAEPGMASATVSWVSAFYSGGSPTMRFLIDCGPTIQQVTAPPSARSATVTGLQPDNAYECSVRAENSFGTSPPSEHSDEFRPL